MVVVSEAVADFVLAPRAVTVRVATSVSSSTAPAGILTVTARSALSPAANEPTVLGAGIDRKCRGSGHPLYVGHPVVGADVLAATEM